MEYLIKKDLLRINRLLQFVIFIILWSLTIILDFDPDYLEGFSAFMLFHWSLGSLLVLFLSHFAVRWNFKIKSAKQKLAPIGYIELGIGLLFLFWVLILIIDGVMIEPIIIITLCSWAISSALHLVLAYIKTVDDGGELRG